MRLAMMRSSTSSLKLLIELALTRVFYQGPSASRFVHSFRYLADLRLTGCACCSIVRREFLPVSAGSCLRLPLSILTLRHGLTCGGCDSQHIRPRYREIT